MQGWLQDLRQAWRQALQRPGFSALVILTLALGVGACVAIFSVVDAAVLAPLPYRDPGRLVAVYSEFHVGEMNFDKFWVSAPEYLELQRWNRAFSALGAYSTSSANVGGDGEPVRVHSANATASLLAALGVEPLLGRLYTAEEDRPGVEPVALVGEGLWRRALGGSRDVLGRTVRLDGRDVTVVGVMPASFDVDDAGIELWQPLGLDPTNPGNRGGHYLYLIGRLAPGSSLAAAQQEVASLLGRWEQEFPATHIPRAKTHPITLRALHEDLVAAARPRMLLLAGAVSLVLLLACANVANLLLARAERRQQEVALRTALGAGRGRLLRQFLTESVALALVGGALGTLFAVWGVNAILAANPGSVVRVATIHLDLRLLAGALGIALVTGILFGIAPAIHARGLRLFTLLKEGARSSAGSSRRLFRSSLVVLQVAIAFLLALGAGLLLKSFRTLEKVSPGFDPEHVLSFQLSLPNASYPTATEVSALYDRLLSGLDSLPGVELASAASGLPPLRQVDANDTEFEGVPKPPEGPLHNVDYYQAVSGPYFETMGIQLAKGRFFAPSDAGSSTLVAVVNERLAKVFWPGQEPIGKRLRPAFSADPPWFTVVGVVADVKQGGLNKPVGTELYVLNAQVATAFDFHYRSLNLLLRTQGDPLLVAAAARAEVRKLDPALPVAGLAPMREVVASSISNPRLLALLVSIFGGVALLLAAIGTYGVLTYSVEERRHELGVRLALGAEARSVLQLVLRSGLTLVGVGLAVGALGFVAARRLLEKVLFEVPANDPATLLAALGLLVVVALVACLVPAARAMRVDPLRTLKAE